MIKGVLIKPLRQSRDERGTVLTMLRSDDPEFHGFGEIYFSTVNTGVVKRWHNHRLMELNYAVPVGKILLVLYDSRKESSTYGEIQELSIGAENYCLVKIPPGVWNAFQGAGDGVSLVANCSTLPHSADEIERLEPADPRIPYTWKVNVK